jgi:hypothetical protein
LALTLASLIFRPISGVKSAVTCWKSSCAGSVAEVLIRVCHMIDQHTSMPEIECRALPGMWAVPRWRHYRTDWSQGSAFSRNIVALAIYLRFTHAITIAASAA